MGSLDTMFAQLVLDSTWATILAGFILIIIILIMGIVAFGRHGVQLGGYGIFALIFISAVLCTAIGLFPAYILLVFLVLGVVAIVLKTLFFGGS